MKIKEDILGKYFYVTPQQSDPSGAYNLSDLCLVRFNRIQDMSNAAGYLCTFDLIAGNPEKCFGDVCWTDEGCVGKIGLASMARLSDQSNNKFIKYLQIGERISKLGLDFVKENK